MLDYFRTEYAAMNFESETETQPAENFLQKLATKKLKVKKSWKKKIGDKYSFETQKLSFGASPTLTLGDTSSISDLKLRIKSIRTTEIIPQF